MDRRYQERRKFDYATQISQHRAIMMTMGVAAEVVVAAQKKSHASPTTAITIRKSAAHKMAMAIISTVG